MPAPRKGVGGGPPVGGAPARRLARGVHITPARVRGWERGSQGYGVSRDMHGVSRGLTCLLAYMYSYGGNVSRSNGS